jgi:glucokinase
MEQELNEFLKGDQVLVTIPGTSKMVNYDSAKRIGIAISKLGASKAIALGAYAFALNALDSNESTDRITI